MDNLSFLPQVQVHSLHKYKPLEVFLHLRYIGP